MSKKAVIVVAGGSGKRMGASIPKQFLEIDGKAILLHTLEQFIAYDNSLEIVLVLPENQMDYWQKLTTNWPHASGIQIAPGGKERFFSVQNALTMLSPDCTEVAVHDGVRPFINAALLKRAFDSLRENQAAIPVLASVDSIRILDSESGNSRTANRNEILRVQTPQMFDVAILKKAYTQDFSDRFTDDASVVEQLGISIALFEGEALNIKITGPEDLKLADAILRLHS
jgi:2-C-methyl-D-erythritol 4-phosphate cytidylyltransferase